MHIPHLPASVQSIEIVWTLVGLAGLCVSVPFTLRFWRQRRKLRDDGRNGGDDILATMYMVAGLLLVSKHVAIALMGAAAMLIVPASDSARLAPTGAAITLAILYLGGASVATAWWLELSHARLHAYLRKTAGAEHLTGAIHHPHKEGA